MNKKTAQKRMDPICTATILQAGGNNIMVLRINSWYCMGPFILVEQYVNAQDVFRHYHRSSASYYVNGLPCRGLTFNKTMFFIIKLPLSAEGSKSMRVTLH